MNYYRDKSNWLLLFFFAWRQQRPPFFLLIIFHQAVRAFERQISQGEALYKCRLLRSAFQRRISKIGHNTKVGCCEVKILHLEQNAGLSAAPNSFRGERGTAFFLSFFLVSLSHALLRSP